MMKFRRSIKNEKHDSAKSAHVALPQKDAFAIQPPKKVIKALYDYTAPPDPSNVYLSFHVGDFLHVVARENDADWYEACNPLRNERGLVPVKYFEEVGKTVRHSGDSSHSHTSTTHDSGYGEGATPPAQAPITSAPRMSVNGGPAAGSNGVAAGHRSSKSVSKSNKDGVYGIVMYDFHAERPDELDAKAGEAIIVIAQSNPEWFVAKPITRLGGPGLIPVSFIEIRDMTTGQAAPDPLEAVQKAGVPRVEEWKKMAAEYKNTSIPLGTVSGNRDAQSLQAELARMSLGAEQQNGNSYDHQRQQSNATSHQQQQDLQTEPVHSPTRASVPRYIYADDKFHFIVECQMSNGTHWDLSRIYEHFYDLQIKLINAYPDEAGRTGKTRILPYMPGPVKFVTDNISEGRRVNLDEYLRDLLRLPPHIAQSALVRNFFEPRDGDYEVDPAAVDLNDHARAADGYSTQNSTTTPRYSQTSQDSSSYNNGAASSQQHQSQPLLPQQQPQSRHMSAATQHSVAPSSHHYTASQASNSYGHQRAQQSQASASFTNPQEYPSAPSLHSAHPSLSAPAGIATTTDIPAVPAAAAPPPKSSNGGAPYKIKCWFNRDTCVVIRMPPAGHFNLQSVWQRVLERRRLEFKDRAPDDEARLDMEYRNDVDHEYYRIESDGDLQYAVTNMPGKLTIAVRDVTLDQR